MTSILDDVNFIRQRMEEIAASETPNKLEPGELTDDWYEGDVNPEDNEEPVERRDPYEQAQCVDYDDAVYPMMVYDPQLKFYKERFTKAIQDAEKRIIEALAQGCYGSHGT